MRGKERKSYFFHSQAVGWDSHHLHVFGKSWFSAWYRLCHVNICSNSSGKIFSGGMSLWDLLSLQQPGTQAYNKYTQLPPAQITRPAEETCLLGWEELWYWPHQGKKITTWRAGVPEGYPSMELSQSRNWKCWDTQKLSFCSTKSIWTSTPTAILASAQEVTPENINLLLGRSRASKIPS